MISSINFKGMSVKSVHNFMPKVDNNTAGMLSSIMDEKLPYDELVVSDVNNKNVVVCKKMPYGDIPVEEISYKGADDSVSKAAFLYALADKITRKEMF